MMATSNFKIALYHRLNSHTTSRSTSRKWVESVITPTLSSSATLELVDLADYTLPLSPTGSSIPARITLPGVPVPKGAYGNPVVDAWSEKMAGFDAFVFVTPQYNWSIPGVLKVALDHLYHEWAGKPAVIVSYGISGGEKAAAALKEIWQWIRGGGIAGGVELLIVEGQDLAQTEGKLKDGQADLWVKEGKDGRL